MNEIPVVVPLTVQEEAAIPLGVQTGDEPVALDIGTEIVTRNVPTYDGSYDVTPLPGAEIILETADKRMLDDVTVREIPYYETTNEAGGYTVIIG